jgi:hypothetical protein
MIFVSPSLFIKIYSIVFFYLLINLFFSAIITKAKACYYLVLFA